MFASYLKRRVCNRKSITSVLVYFSILLSCIDRLRIIFVLHMICCYMLLLHILLISTIMRFLTMNMSTPYCSEGQMLIQPAVSLNLPFCPRAHGQLPNKQQAQNVTRNISLCNKTNCKTLGCRVFCFAFCVNRGNNRKTHT